MPKATLCDLCYRPTFNRKPDEQGEIWCDDCRRELARIQSMDPAELRADELAMARYGDEDEGL